MGCGWGASGQDERLLQGAKDGAGLAKCCSWGECDLACFRGIGAQALSPWQSEQSSQVTSLMLSLGLLSSPQLFPSCLPASCVSAPRLQVPLEDGGSASVLELGDGHVRWLERSEGGPSFSVGARGWLPAQTSMQEGGQVPARGRAALSTHLRWERWGRGHGRRFAWGCAAGREDGERVLREVRSGDRTWQRGAPWGRGPEWAKEWALLGLGEGGPVVHGASG